MSTNVTVDREGTVTGNTFDKYGSTNPVVRRLMAGFHASLDELFDAAAPRSILDVGCGEGVLTHEWAQKLDDGRIVGIDLDDPQLHESGRSATAPNLEYRVMKAETCRSPTTNSAIRRTSRRQVAGCGGRVIARLGVDLDNCHCD